MYVNIWEWFDNAERQARLNNDIERLRLPELHRLGWRYIQSSRFIEARTEFENAIKLAHRLKEDWWEFFFEFWMCEVSLLQSNYRQALDECTKLVTKMQRPSLKQHPYQAVVYYTLARAYYLLDALGYEDEIFAAMDTLENDLPLDIETHQRVFYLRAAMAYEKEDWDTAYERTLIYLERVEGNAFRQRSGYTLKGWIHYARGELSDALVACQLREVAARKSNMLRGITYALMWQGMLSHYLGDPQNAEILFQRGVREYESMGIDSDTDAGYWDLVAEYHEACGKNDEALVFRKNHIASAEQNGSIDSLFFAYMKLCYLLNRMKKPPTDYLTTLDDLAHKHRKPDFFIQKVADIKAGKIAQYDWKVTRWQEA